MISIPDTLSWEDETLVILDQRKLPGTVEFLKLHTLEDAWHAINTLAVRGAPAIGIAAAYALAQSMRHVETDRFRETIAQNAGYLKTARPTAVNLFWAIDRLVTRAGTYEALVEEARAIHKEDEAICLAIGKHGAPLVTPGSNILTHCNAGSLAVSRVGTATAPLYHQHARDVGFHVYVDETRPLMQGARLTAWELDRAGIDVTLICDNMAASLMDQGKVDLVIVGTDRVTANGDVVNKIGTLNLAVLCHHFEIPFYVACPSSTFDPLTASGSDVDIESRNPDEVLAGHAADVRAHNPAFDVTPHNLVTGFIAEFGLAHDSSELSELMSNRR